MLDMVIGWSQEKNEELKARRGLCFEDAEVLILAEDICADLPHPNQSKYPGQRVLYLLIDNYVCVVPYVQDGNKMFLNTMFRSRAARKYLLKKDRDDEIRSKTRRPKPVP